MFAKLSGELEGERYWRYRWQVSPCLQEYTEALSFAHYLEHGTLVTLKQVQETISDVDGKPVSLLLVVILSMLSINKIVVALQYFPISVSDYLLGVSDLMGELMRYAISSISKRGGRPKAFEICKFVRECKAGKPPSSLELPSFITCQSIRFRIVHTQRQRPQQEAVGDSTVAGED